MVIFTVVLTDIILPTQGDDFDNLNELTDLLLEQSFEELNSKLDSEIWCFVPKVLSKLEPFPKISIYLEVNDDYYYADISTDVTKVFEKNLAAIINTRYGNKKMLSRSLKAKILTDPFVVADLYSQRNDRDICEPLVRALEDTDKIIRAAAIDALVSLNDLYAASSILWMLLHGSVFAREAAAEVLGVIGKGDILATQYLTKALEDSDSTVRNAAIKALNRLKVY